MAVNGVEQVRLALLALPTALGLNKISSESFDTSSACPMDVIKTTDERMADSLRLVADHIADEVIRTTANLG